MQARNQKFFKAGKVSWNQGTSINISSKTHEHKASQAKFSEFFLLDTVKITFRMKNLIQRWTDLGHFVSKIRALFSILRNPPLVERLPCYDEASTVNSVENFSC